MSPGGTEESPENPLILSPLAGLGNAFSCMGPSDQSLGYFLASLRDSIRSRELG